MGWQLHEHEIPREAGVGFPLEQPWANVSGKLLDEEAVLGCGTESQWTYLGASLHKFKATVTEPFPAPGNP
jgi:hypothetical protein